MQILSIYPSKNGQREPGPAISIAEKGFSMKISKETLQVAFVKSPYGLALIACSLKGICSLMLGDGAKELRDDLRRRFPKASLVDAGPELDPLLSKVLRFLESPKLGLDAALDLRGTDFQRLVWRALCKIPAGSTSTYSEIARRIGLPKAIRAVGTACGANPVAVAVPCHRVLTSDGKISGYRWGVERKRILLEKEGRPGLPIHSA
jgi:AraC family transcriptional regulator of adaptative response/methylated-DNA-[protein]-cysteine methyltransferase